MITGDKQETAINIAIACRLVHHPDNLIIINAADSNKAARARLEEALLQCRDRTSAGAHGADGKASAALVSSSCSTAKSLGVRLTALGALAMEVGHHNFFISIRGLHL